MAGVTLFAVVTFDRNDDGELKLSERLDMPSAGAADSMAHYLARYHVGALACAWTGAPMTAAGGDAVVIVSLGEVDTTALTNWNKP